MTASTFENPTIPWPLVPLKRVLRFRNGEPFAHVESSHGDYPVYGSGGEFARADDYLHDGTSVLFGRKGTVDKPLLVRGRFWCIDTMFYTRLDASVDARFVHYFSTTIPYNLLATDTARPSMTQTDLGEVKMPFPTIQEQRAIADFLDRETAQIDAMIEAQEQVVARLTERRSSTITALVTGHALGLPLTASGNALLGEVPEGWDVSRFGRHTRINGGQVDPGVEPWNEMILVAPNHVESGTGRLLALETAAEQGADSGKYLVRKGQIVYSKIRPSLNKVTIAPQDVLCSADMYGITCLGDGDHRYFANFMLATPFHQYATMVSDRVKMPKINREELSAAPWLVPPVADQTRIADLVDATTRELDTAISETRALSALLHERRRALITAAVTGRIDPTTGIERIDRTTEKEAS